jgi:sporulation protein YlmC with PRC-barrel domain
MLRKLMISTAAAALAAGTAIAQAPSEKMPSPAPKMETPAPKAQPAPTTGQSTRAGGQFVMQQTADQWLASKFKGTDVIGTNNEKIGDVSDILFDKDGKVLAYIVGVGGFLGIGSKDVALAPAAFQVQPASDRDELKLKLAMSKDDLKNAPEFKVYTAPRSGPTTGQAPDRNRAPAAPPSQK